NLTFLLLAAGVLLTLPLGAKVLLLGLLGTGAGFIYNAWAKRTPLSWVPFWIALPTLVVASFEVAGGYQERLLVTYAIGLPLTIAVYLADAMIDAESDRAAGVNNVVARLGPLGSRLTCWLTLATGYLIAALGWPAGSPGILF